MVIYICVYIKSADLFEIDLHTRFLNIRTSVLSINKYCKLSYTPVFFIALCILRHYPLVRFRHLVLLYKTSLFV